MRKITANLLFILIFTVVATGWLISCGGSERNDNPISMSMPLLTKPSAHGKGVGWKRADCTTCHSVTSLPTVHPRIVGIAGVDTDEVCMMCHLGNGTGKGPDMPECVRCHTDPNVFGTEAISVAGYSAHTVTNPPAAGMTDFDCVVCHDSTNMDGKLTADDLSALTNRNGSDNPVWDRGSLNNFCFTCHSAGGAETQGISIRGINIKDCYPKDYHGDEPYYGTVNSLRPGNTAGSSLSCLSCHRQHASDNRKLFITSGAETRIVTDENAKNAAVVLDRNNHDLRDLCAICHAGDSALPGSIPAPNGLYQVSRHTDNVCYICHADGGMRPPQLYPLGASLASQMMGVGDSCSSCHRHGANMGPSSTQYPSGTTHSKF